MTETVSAEHELKSRTPVAVPRLTGFSRPTAERREPVAEMQSTRPQRKLKVCMLAACPFPANHGTPGSIREMAESITDLGHEVHIVTYHFGEDIPVRGPQ